MDQRAAAPARAREVARTCFDHVAGRLGVAPMAALIADGSLTGGDGRHRVGADGEDRLSGPGRDLDYRLTAHGARCLAGLRVAVPEAGPDGAPVRYCIDWTEQAHHLSGLVGRALATRLLELGWVRRADRGRALHVTAAGRTGLAAEPGVVLESSALEGPGVRAGPPRGQL